MNEIFNNIYFNPRHPGSFGGINKLFKYAKLEDPNIKLKDVINWLRYQNVYTLHKPIRKHFLRNRIFASHANEQWEADLVDMIEFSRENDGYKHILVVIDVFTKYLYLKALKSKETSEVIKAFEEIFRSSKPLKLRTDRGKEFDNNLFKRFCTTNNIKVFTTQNRDIKCAVVERVNRTIKSMMHRYFTSVGNRRYLNLLPQLAESYNNTIHSSTKMAPSAIRIEDEPTVFRNLYKTNNLLSIYKSNKKPTLRVGDQVRQKLDLSVLDKSYYPNWTNIVYNIDKVHNKLNKSQYSVELDGEKLARRFYPEELQKILVNENTEWPIERILSYRTRDGIRQARVKWTGYPSQFNQWIPVDQIRNL